MIGVDDMKKLKQYLQQPNVEINGKEFVDKKLLLELLDERFQEERKDAESDDERNGIDICRNVIANWM